MGGLADRDADLLRTLGGQLIDDHRAVSPAACADQPADVRLARATPPHLSDHGARQYYLDRATQRLLEDAEQQRRPPLQGDEGTRVENESSHAACPALPDLWARCLR